MKAKKISLIASIFFATILVYTMIHADSVFTQAVENDFIKILKKNFSSFNEKLPQDRVYLQFDKTFYEPGDNIWFSAYVRDAETMKQSEQSDIVHIQFISPKGTVDKELQLIVKNGKAIGDFKLADEMPGGLYKIKAFTNWQLNEPDSLFFEKELMVQDVILPNLKMKLDFERKAYGAGDDVIAKVDLQTNENNALTNFAFKYVASLNGEQLIVKPAETGNDGTMYIKFTLPKKLKSNDGLLNILVDYQGKTESISRSIPISLNAIKLAFYPEGGDLVNGLESRIAFKALNEFGKPADVEGEVTDSKGNVVASFTSFHQGMGAFNLKTEAGEKYFARISKPVGNNQTFELPEMMPRGYVINIDNENKNEIGVAINSTENEELSLVAQVRGKIYYATAVEAKQGLNKITIPTNLFPIGVSQVTLFDSKGIARCERLVFVNKDKQLNIEIKTDKDKYLPREKITATIYVKDERGMPMPANISLTVTNDQLLSFADDKQGNILSELLLQQDLKGKVEEPAFYFSKEKKADKALDFLMMTNGWRRFTWEKIMTNEIPAITYQGEKTRIAGTVIDATKGTPVANATISFNDKQRVQTNDKGQYTIKGLDLSKPMVMNVRAAGFQDANEQVYQYDVNKMIYLYDKNYRQIEVVEMNEVPVMMDNAEMADNINARGMVIEERVINAPKPKAIPAAKFAAINAKDIEKPEVKAINNGNKVGAKMAAQNLNALQVVDGPVMKRKRMEEKEILPQQPLYYRAREFAVVDYSKSQDHQLRTDFRSTIYWNPDVEIDKSGKKVIEFYASDEITSFRCIAEGASVSGQLGREEKTIYTQLPFSMSVKVPTEVVQQDVVEIPLTLKNNTQKILNGKLNIKAPIGFVAQGTIPSEVTIDPATAKTIYLKYVVASWLGVDSLRISFNAQGNSDAFMQPVKTVAKGFPVTASFSGKETNTAYHVDLKNVIDGSVKVTVTAYPSVVSDLMKGVESILREPGGCFEQTSMSSYPNILVRDYLNKVGDTDPKVEARADKLIDNGYKKLITFETKEKGYEWFGGAPGHEALTAYGLMQFNDMKAVYAGVDQKMIDRNAAWLMDKKDGNGGYKRNARALDNFGGASPEITNAYITYALSCAGYKDINKELDHLYKSANSSKDPYIIGLAANALFAHDKDKRAQNVLDDLLKLQDKNGSFNGLTHSITRSTDNALRIETTSLAVMAMLQSSNVPNTELNNAVEFLTKARSGYGDFGNTQSTIMALKALTAYAEFSKATNEAGTLEFYVDGKKVGEKDYVAGQREAIVIDGMEKYISSGKYKLELKYRHAKNPLPYSIAITWNTYLPQSAKECKIDLETVLAAKQTKTGEILRLTATIKNTTNEGLPSTMAIIGIPAGCSPQPWQLKEMMEKKKIDYYEVKGNKVFVYYRQMAPSEIKILNFDLKAEVPGNYEAAASCAYLYYTNEYKCWTSLPKLKVG